MVICNADGGFIAASAKKLSHIASILTVEAEALRDSVRLLSLGIDRVIVETDSLELASLQGCRGKNRSEIVATFRSSQQGLVLSSLFMYHRQLI